MNRLKIIYYITLYICIVILIKKMTIKLTIVTTVSTACISSHTQNEIIKKKMDTFFA